MKTRQAKKILFPVLRGGRTTQINRYWWHRVYGTILGTCYDHRAREAMKTIGADAIMNYQKNHTTE